MCRWQVVNELAMSMRLNESLRVYVRRRLIPRISWPVSEGDCAQPWSKIERRRGSWTNEERKPSRSSPQAFNSGQEYPRLFRCTLGARAYRGLPFMAWYLKASRRRRPRLNHAPASSTPNLPILLGLLSRIRDRSIRDVHDVLYKNTRLVIIKCQISSLQKCRMYGFSYQELVNRMMSSIEGKRIYSWLG